MKATGFVGEATTMKWKTSMLEMNVMKMPPEPALHDELGRLVEGGQDGRQDIVLDFTDVDIVTSASLARLLQLRELLKDSHCELFLCSMSKATKSIFAITGLETVFRFCDHAGEALHRVEPSRGCAWPR